MEMAAIAGNQVLIMFLLIGVGIVAAKAKLISEKGSNDINKVLIMLVSPSIIIFSYYRPFDRELFGSLLYSFLLAIISHFIAIGLALLFLRGSTERNKIERFAVIFSNSGFMGIPLIAAVIGPDGVVFASTYMVIFTLMQWSVGVIILQGKTDIKTLAKKLLLNPGVISVTIGLALFFLPVKLPTPLSSALEYMASLNTPLAMLVVGTFVARTNPLKALKSSKVYIVTALRLIAVPLLMLPIYLLFRDLPFDLLLANYIASACPVAVLAVMFPAMYKMDGKYASNFVTISTLLSVATIPLLVMLFGQLL